MHPLIIEQLATARIADRERVKRAAPIRAARPGVTRVLAGRTLVTAATRLADVGLRISGEVAPARAAAGRRA